MWHLLDKLNITFDDIMLEMTRTGIIDRYNPKYDKGTQPIRVQNKMIGIMFQSTNPFFPNELAKLIKEEKLNNELNLVYGEEPILEYGRKSYTPCVNGDTKTIELHETFLSYLWCIAYSVFVTYIETIDKPRLNTLHKRITHPVFQQAIDKAKEIFQYGIGLIRHFETWDKEKLPNPEIYQAAERDYPEQTSLYYIEAVKFILCHELAHLKLHMHKIHSATPSHFIDYEKEADNYAIEAVKKGINWMNRIAVENGVIISILSMLFFRATTTGTKHPNVEDRLTNALEQLAPGENHEAWGFACIGLKMWDEQFGLSFDWEPTPKTYKDLYFSIVEQIKRRQV